MNLDPYIFQKLNRGALQYGWLDTLGIFGAKYLGYLMVGVLILLLIWNFRKYWLLLGVALGSAVLARFGVVSLIRWFFWRPRPFVGNEVNLLFSHPLTSSFPSGHAAFFFGLSTGVFLRNRKVGMLFFVFSFFVGISRIFCGVHWPSDILAGVGIGIICGLLVNYGVKILRSS